MDERVNRSPVNQDKFCTDIHLAGCQMMKAAQTVILCGSTSLFWDATRVQFP